VHEPTVDFTTPLGAGGAEFSRGRLAACEIAMVSTGLGFGISHHASHGPIVLDGSGWTEPPAAAVHGTTLADAVGKRPFRPDLAVIRAGVAGYYIATATAPPRLAH